MSQTEVQLVKGLNLDPAAPADATKVDSSGRFLVGTSTSGKDSAKLQIAGGDNTNHIELLNTTASDTNGQRYSYVWFRGRQSGGEESSLAFIGAVHDGSSDDEKGRLIFHTNDGNDGDSPTERLRIDSSGRVLIGTTTAGHANADELTLENSAGAAGVTIRAAANFNSNIYFADPGSAQIGQIEYRHNGDTMRFYTFGSEVMRNTSTGELMFNSGYGSVATAYGCRAWVNFQGKNTVTIREDGNVSSVADNGLGQYTVNFSNSFVDDNYAVAQFCRADSGGGMRVCVGRGTTGFATGSIQVEIRNGNNNLEDVEEVCLAFFR